VVPGVGMDPGEYCTWGFCNLIVNSGMCMGPLEASRDVNETRNSRDPNFTPVPGISHSRNESWIRSVPSRNLTASTDL